MINIHDVFGLCSCTKKDIIKTAITERVPDVVAATLAEYKKQHPNTVYQLRKPLTDSIKIKYPPSNLEVQCEPTNTAFATVFHLREAA